MQETTQQHQTPSEKNHSCIPLIVSWVFDETTARFEKAFQFTDMFYFSLMLQ